MKVVLFFFFAGAGLSFAGFVAMISPDVSGADVTVGGAGRAAAGAGAGGGTDSTTGAARGPFFLSASRTLAIVSPAFADARVEPPFAATCPLAGGFASSGPDAGW